MADYNNDRASYNAAMLSQKNGIYSNSNVLVNPSVGTGIFNSGMPLTARANVGGSSIGRSTLARGNVSDEEIDERNKKERNGWQTFWDQIGDIGNQITTGVLNFCDGIGDFFGWIVGSIADASGNQQLANDVKNNWINVDWINPAMAAFDMATNPSHVMSGDIFTGDYWKKYGELGDVLSGNGANTQLMKDYQENRGWLKDNELYNTITQGIGSVVPSIVLGIVSGGASVPVQLLATLGPLGLSAFGNEAQEALENDATYGQAGAAGAIGGAIEVGTELASMGIGKGIGAITGKATSFGTHIAGVGIGKELAEQGAKKGIKAIGKELVKDMVEEGLEEVASELLNPLAKAVYDDKAFDAYTTSEGRQKLLKDSAMAFVGGAAGSLVGGFVSTRVGRARFGGEVGADLATQVSQIQEIKEAQLKEAKKGNLANQQLIQQYTQQIEALCNKYESDLANFKQSDPANFKKYASAMLNVKKAIMETSFSNDSDVSDALKTQIQNSFKSNPYDIEAQEISKKTKGINANEEETTVKRANLQQKGGDSIHGYSKGSSEIKISTKENTQFYNKVAHELSHTITNQASEKTFNDIYDRFKKVAPEKMTKYQKMIIENYIDDYKGSVVYKSSGKIDYVKTVNNINKNKSQLRTLKSESMAHMLESVIGDRKSLNRILNANTATDAKVKSKLLATLTNIRNKLGKSENSKIINVVNDAIKQIKENNNEQFNREAKLAFSKENKNGKESNIRKVEGSNKEVSAIRSGDNRISEKTPSTTIREIQDNIQPIRSDLRKRGLLERKTININGNNVSAEFLKQTAVKGELLELQQENEKMGLKTNFVILNSNYSGDFDVNTKSITINLNSKTTVDTNRHEKAHYICSTNTEIANNFKNQILQSAEEKINNGDQLLYEVYKNIKAKYPANVVQEEIIAYYSQLYPQELNNYLKKEFKLDDIKYSKSQKFTNIKNTTQLLDNTIDNINSKLGENTYIELPTAKSKLESKVFTAINSKVEAQAQANALMETLKKANVMSMNNETDAFQSLGTVQELLTEEQANSLNKELVNALNEMRKGGTVDLENKAVKALKMATDRLGHTLKEVTPRIKTVHNIGKLKTFIPQQIKENFAITDDTITKQGLDFLYTPFAKMKYDSNGKGYRTNGVKENILEVLKMYTPDKFDISATHPMANSNTINLPYNEAIRTNFEQILEQIPAKNSTFDAKTLKLIEQTMRMIKRDSAAARFRETAIVKPYANNTSKAILKHSKIGTVKNLARAFNRMFMPAYEQNRLITGQISSLSELTSTKMIEANNNKTLMVGDYAQKIIKNIKELKVNSDLGKNYKFTVNGGTITVNGTQLVGIYNTLTSQENFEAVNESGLGKEYNKSLNSKTEIYDFVKGHAQELLDAIENNPETEKVIKAAKFLKKLMNTEVKEDYKNWYIKKFGPYNYLNAVDDYWTLSRMKGTVSSVEKLVKTTGFFKNGLTRVDNTHPVLIVDAYDLVGSYINDLATEMYVKPVYRDAYSILNAKTSSGTTIAEQIKATYGQKDLQSLLNSIDEMAGKPQPKDGFFSKLTGKYSVAKLALNVSTMMKQFSSIWTSNIPLRYSVKAMFARLSPSYRTEYKQLINELGGLKYREGIQTPSGKISAVQAGETGAAAFSHKALNKIAEIGMKPISKVDLFTVATGVYSLIAIGENQGFKAGTKENINFVKESWYEFEASQIANNPMAKNAIARGDYGPTVKAFLGFMQGANRAAFGSTVNKATTWARNKGKTEAEVNARFTAAKENYTKLKTEYDETYKKMLEFEDNYDVRSLARKGNLDIQQANALTEYRALEDKLYRIGEEMTTAREEYETARLEKVDFARYKAMGKKAIPLNMAAGLVMQGLFITLINELFKRIKGKKDWDEWDFLEMAQGLGLNTLINWIPGVNAVASVAQGNGLNYGGLGMMEEMVGVYDALKTYIENPTEYNKAKLFKMIATGFGDVTGLPVMTIYDYIYGMIKPFNPDIAWDMKNVFYYQSESTARDTLNQYIEKGDMDKAAKMVQTIMKRFKNGEISDGLAKEMAELIAADYSPLPSSTPTQYKNDKGEVVTLTQDQIAQFNQIYAKSIPMVEKLTSITEYHTATQEEKAKLMKRIYDAYYEVALAKVTKQTANLSKIGKIINGTNIRKIPQIFGVLNTASSITASKTKSKKELVLDYINKLKGYSKQEKTLMMFLAGYSVSGSSQVVLRNYLITSGMSRKDAKELVG